MSLELVLNDLSLLPPANDIYAARERMAIFMATFLAAVSLGAERVLRTSEDMNGIELASGYSIAQWRNDSDVNQDARHYLKRIATKKPYLHEIHDVKIIEAYYTSDFYHAQRQATGLGMAFLLDTLAISFHSHSLWATSSLQLLLTQLREDDSFDETRVAVKHICLKEHAFEHRAWIKKRTETKIESGADLFTYSSQLYPHLQFCKSALTQLQALPHGEIHLRQIMRHLQDLDNYCANWSAGAFSSQNIPGKITEESRVTLGKYEEDHTFELPDGRKIIFSWHVRITPGKWRIYFYPVATERIIVIGHIGTKLQNINYPT